MRLYRHLFKPSATLSKPYSMIGVIAAETDEARASRPPRRN